LHPHILLLRIIDSRILIRKLSHEKSLDKEFVFVIFGTAEESTLATYCPKDDPYQQFLKIIMESNFECVICGDEYDAGFPSVEMVAEHVTNTHKLFPFV